MKQILTKKVLYYALGGVLATIVDLGLLYILTEFLHIHYMSSQIISFCISFIVGFLFQKYITFNYQQGKWGYQILLFFIFQLIGLGINLIVLHLSVEYLYLHYMIGSILSKGIVFVRNFMMNNYYNFRD